MANVPDSWFDDNLFEDFVVQDMDALEFRAYPELPRKLLYMDGIGEWPNLPELANHWLTELAETGLLELDPDQEAPLKQADHRRPTRDPRGGKLYPVRVEGHRQTFWIQVDGQPRYGVKSEYKPIKVLDKPLRTQTGIVSLLTALEANPMDLQRLRETLSEPEPPLTNSVLAYRLRYVLALLRYYRPSFDELSHEERWGLVEKTYTRVNQLLTASRQLMEFLEYGEPDRDHRPALENANRDVQAAVLHAVEDMSASQIAKRLRVASKGKYQTKGGHRTVEKMVERGKKLLKDALGEDGWQKQIEAMKADREWFNSLDETQQGIYLRLDRDRMTEEEAREYVARYG